MSLNRNQDKVSLTCDLLHLGFNVAFNQCLDTVNLLIDPQQFKFPSLYTPAR